MLGTLCRPSATLGLSRSLHLPSRPPSQQWKPLSPLSLFLVSPPQFPPSESTNKPSWSPASSSLSAVRGYSSSAPTQPPSNKEGEGRGGGGGGRGRRSDEQQRKNVNLLLYLIAVGLGMLALSYASVPLYRLFCQVTGLGGVTGVADNVKDRRVDRKKEFTVNFRSQSNTSLPWLFTPMQDSIDLYPGETGLAFFTATNVSDEPIIGVATYMVNPPVAGRYFEKIECFCFDEQRIGPGETVDMPVLFTINPDINQHESLRDVYDLTLSYTFFRSNDQSVYDFDDWDDIEKLEGRRASEVAPTSA
eukprot:TRINITY_DN5279_c0_g1_i1.p1 TRINITY_DN5279_c0_g1~~TRINITY_DN5279_c0_g1_i1.p1  ORF type:complete len:304 (+),score=76.55 TRINITY_DN5279_c0_g1_i1:142-1053(+)